VSPEELAISAGKLDIHARASVVRTSGQQFAAVASSARDRRSGDSRHGSWRSHAREESAEIDGSVGNVWSAGAVELGHRASVHGFVRSAADVEVQRGAVISGALEQNTDVPFRVIERPAAFPSVAREDVTVRRSVDRSLSPGGYDDVSVRAGGILRLSAGSYFFNELDLANGSEVVLENADQPVYIYVRSRLSYAGKLTERAEGERAGNLWIGYLGERGVELHTPLRGTLVAPRARVVLHPLPGDKPDGFGPGWAGHDGQSWQEDDAYDRLRAREAAEREEQGEEGASASFASRHGTDGGEQRDGWERDDERDGDDRDGEERRADRDHGRHDRDDDHWRDGVRWPHHGGGIPPKPALSEHRGAVFAREVELLPHTRLVHVPFPALLLTQVSLSDTTPCSNEPILVEARTMSLAGVVNDPAVDVRIDGLPGARRTVQFQGIGPREIVVVASDGNIASSRTLTVELQECAGQSFARVATRASVYHPYSVEFQVLNAAELQGQQRKFVWDFGDGTTRETEFPYVEHSYLGSLDATSKSLQFEAQLRITRQGRPDVVASKMLVIPNLYAETRARGYVRPPLVSDVRLQRDGKALRGNYTLRNLERDAITFDSRQLQRHFCDPDLDPELLPSEGIGVTVAGGEALSDTLVLERAQFASNTCGLSLILSGKTADGIDVRTSVHFETPEEGFFAAPVADPQVLSLLNQVAADGRAADPNRISGEELNRLYSEGRISFLPTLNDINTGALQDGEVIGQPCDPEQTPPRAGVACQATEEWRVTPPLIRNALKGDVMIVAACGEIGQLLRAVIPRQEYSHEGIMTRNYYGLSHSTADGGLILDTVGNSISNQLSEPALKYAWPGTLHASVNDAFNGGRYLAPNGSFRTLSGFNVNATQCDGDSHLNPPVLIRPPIGSDASIREQLHAAADIAAATESHYRFFAYSQANIAFDPPDNFSGSNYRAPDGERPTVSTSFI
jgi:hypothetical protein